MSEHIPGNQPSQTESETRKKFDLSTLLTYENPNALVIQKLVQEATTGSSDPQYVHFGDAWDPRERMWENQNLGARKKVFDALKELRVGITIDLGSPYSRIPYLLKEDAPEVLLSVDLYRGSTSGFLPKEENRESIAITNREMIRKTEVVHVRADMLDFISRVASGSVNIQIDGIDRSIIRIPEYHVTLAAEIKRVTRLRGLVFGAGSDALEKYLEQDPDFEIIWPTEQAPYTVLRKHASI